MMRKTDPRSGSKLARPTGGPSLVAGYTDKQYILKTLPQKPNQSPRFAWLHASYLPRDAFQIFVTHPSHRCGASHFDSLSLIKAMRLAHRGLHHSASGSFPCRCYVSGVCAGVCKSGFDADIEARVKNASPHILRRILAASNSHHSNIKAHRASRNALLIQKHRR